METKVKINKREYRIIGITLVAGLLLGWAFFHNPGNSANEQQDAEAHDHSTETIWTCSMHPQIRMDEPGQCPICGMDLIPLTSLTSSESTTSAGEIQMSDDAMKIADIQTMTVQNTQPEKEVYLLGKVKPDERNIAELTARFGGRIDKLYVNFTGQEVRKGEKLATIYSPALITAQKELLEAQAYRQTNPDLYRAARNKLKLWDLTDEQIDRIETEGETQLYFDVLSPISGTVTNRHVALGDYMKEGSSMFQVIDLSRVWVMFEAYENDLPWIRNGDKVQFAIQSLPDRSFTGRIGFIDPMINPQTRIAQVRVEVPNPGLLLKPEMFASGIVSSTIAGNSREIVIPKSAVLWTGKRAVVYVKEPYRDQPTFRYEEITLGPSAGNSYVVESGLQEGDEIAVNGVFSIDAAAQLAGKTSMMNAAVTGTAGVQPQAGNADLIQNVTEMNMEATGTVPGSSSESAGGSTGRGSVQPDTQETTTDQGIDPKFTEQLTGVYDVYVELKNAFVQSSPEDVAKSATAVTQALGKVDMTLLGGETHMVWMDQLGALRKDLDSMVQTQDIEEQRAAFAALTQVFYQCIKDYGLEGVTTYYQYCPMAFNSTGAYWLSEVSEIKNPYYGDAMLTCGETKETLEY